MPFSPAVPPGLTGAQQFTAMLNQFAVYVLAGGDAVYGSTVSVTYRETRDGPSDLLISYAIEIPADLTLNSQAQLVFSPPSF
jgi:hypothetical protein